MTYNQILDEALKSISRLMENEDFVDNKIEKKIKLILENLILSAKIEILDEISERRE